MLPQIVVTVNGKRARALVDTSCTTTLVTTSITKDWNGASNIRAVDGRDVKCCGETNAEIIVRNIPLRLRVIELDTFVAGIEVILGLDTINRLGGVTIAKGEVVRQGEWN